MNNKKTKPNKYALDSSAAFYPFFTTKKSQSMYCVGAELKDDVDKELLERAANDAIRRFPLYKTKLKRGYGAYKLQENDAHVKVFDLSGKVLVPIDVKETNGFQFRIACGGRRIIIEIFHALTDANGAFAFLNATIRRYRELQGVVFPSDCEVAAWDSPVPDEELEDSFKKNYKPIPFSALNLKGMAGGVPHSTKGTPLKDGYILDGGEANVASLVACAKAAGVSLTAYIAGVAGYGILKSSKPILPVVLMVPVNLRKLFPSQTTSNFVTFVRLILKPSECKTLGDCISVCSKQLAEKAAKDKMEAFISTTVRAQKNIIFRCVPLWLKWIFIRLGRLVMKSRQTMIISNVGNISLPDEMGVEAITLNLNVSKNNVQNLGVSSYGGRCRMIFTSAIEQLTVPSAVFNTFEEQGVKITKTEIICLKSADKPRI